MKPTRKKLLLALTAPLVLAVVLLWVGRSPSRPRPIYRLAGTIEWLQVSGPRNLYVITEEASQVRTYALLDGSTGRIFHQDRWGHAVSGIDVESAFEMYPPSVTLPDGRRTGMCHSPPGLRLVSPDGREQVLPLPPIRSRHSSAFEWKLLDVRYLSKTNQLLALTDNTISYLDVAGRKPPRAVRIRPVGAASASKSAPVSWSWDSDNDLFPEEGPSISPDGKYIAGFRRRAGVQYVDIFDAASGSALKHLRLHNPGPCTSPNPTNRIYWIGGSENLLVQKTNWRHVQCLSWRTGKVRRRFHWQPVSDFNSRADQGFLALENRLYAEVSGKDIVLRETLTGKAVRRARDASPAGLLPPHMAIAPDGETLYFQPVWEGGRVDKSLWRWPTTPE